MSHTQDQGAPVTVQKPRRKSGGRMRTVREAVKLLMEIALPIAIGVYTVVTSDQTSKSAEVAAMEQNRIALARQDYDFERSTKAYQQQLFKDFLDTMYLFHKDGELGNGSSPWAFANARYRAVHTEFDADRKGQALLFFKEKQLIGRRPCKTGCETEDVKDVIRLDGLSFDRVNLNSETGTLSSLNLGCIQFDRISMVNASFANADLNGARFSNARLSGAKFEGISVKCARFENTEMDGVDFGESDLSGAVFVNTNLSTTKFTATQLQQAQFVNVIMANGSTLTSVTTVETIALRTYTSVPSVESHILSLIVSDTTQFSPTSSSPVQSKSLAQS
jgi:hypothetical protein